MLYKCLQIMQKLSENWTHMIINIPQSRSSSFPFIQCTSTEVLHIQCNHGIIELEQVIMQ